MNSPVNLHLFAPTDSIEKVDSPLVAALRLLLDRCEPHGNFKPCIHCAHQEAPHA